MAIAEHHSKSSVSTFGGLWQDYFPIHNFFDVTRDILAPHWEGVPDFRHRALRHHDVGIDLAVWVFDQSIMNSDGVSVDVRDISEQHMIEDFDCIPAFDDWWLGVVTPFMINDDGAQMMPLVKNIRAQSWMNSKARVLAV